MKLYIFLALIPFCCSLSLYSHIDGEKELIYIKHRHSRVRRSEPHTEFKFPERMSFSFVRQKKSVRLNVVRSKHLNRHVPVRFIKDGRVTKAENMDARKDYAHYEMLDGHVGAAVIARCPNFTYPCHLQGHIHIGGEEFVAEPDNTLTPVGPRMPHVFRKVSKTLDFYGDTSLVDLSEALPPHPQRIDRKERRQKRQAGSNTVTVHYIEIEMVTDESIYEYFENVHNTVDDIEGAITTYYELVASAINLRYSTINREESSIDVKVVPLAINIATNPTPWTVGNLGTRVEGQTTPLFTTALESFRLWAIQNRDDLSDYDHIMAFTKYELSSVNTDGSVRTGVAGIAKQAASSTPTSLVCRSRNNAVSLVEDGRGGESAGIAAHELGHNLGVGHDNTPECNIEDQYIMAPGRDVTRTQENEARHPWTFSPCSIRALKTSLDNLVDDGFTCTRTHVFDEAEFARILDSTQAGKMYDPDFQCRHAYGADSFFCNADVYPDICWSDIYCYNPADAQGRCFSVKVLSGTPCDTGKHCFLGECVDNSITSEIKSTTTSSTTTTTSATTTTTSTTEKPTTTTSTTTEQPTTTSTTEKATTTTTTEKPTTTTAIEPTTTTTSKKTTTTTTAEPTTTSTTEKPTTTSITEPTTTTTTEKTTTTTTTEPTTTTSTAKTTTSTPTTTIPTTTTSTTEQPTTTEKTTTVRQTTTTTPRTTTNEAPTTTTSSTTTTSTQAPTSSSTTTESPTTTPAFCNWWCRLLRYLESLGYRVRFVG